MMKYYVSSYSDFRLNKLLNGIKKIDKEAEIVIVERIDYFFMDFKKIEGPVKIIIDSDYDDIIEPDELREVLDELILDKFNGSTGIIDIYVFNIFSIFEKNIYRFENLEIRIHDVSFSNIIFNNIFKELYKNTFSPKKVVFYDNNVLGFQEACCDFLESEILCSDLLPYNHYDVADFSFFKYSKSDDVLIITPRAQIFDNYLECANKLEYKGRIFLTSKEQGEKIKKLNLPNEVVEICCDNPYFLLDNPIYNKFEFARYVRKYLKYLTGTSDDAVDEAVDDVLDRFNLEKLPIIFEEIIYIYKVGKNNKGITYYDFSNTLDLIDKINQNKIKNKDVLKELEKSEKYITGIPPVMVNRFFRLCPRCEKYKGLKFDDIIIGFCNLVSEKPAMFVNDDLLISYAMFLAMVSIIKSEV